MSDMNEVRWENVLRHAAAELHAEGRYNQSSILTDAATAFEELRARIAELEGRADAYVQLQGKMGAKERKLLLRVEELESALGIYARRHVRKE